jgi:hypothetical protein
MWPFLGLLFWIVWISLVGWQWFAEWNTWRYIRSHHGILSESTTVLRKRRFFGPDGVHYYVTFKVPGALPIELAVSASTYALARRGARGIVLVRDDAMADFHQTG